MENIIPKHFRALESSFICSIPAIYGKDIDTRLFQKGGNRIIEFTKRYIDVGGIYIFNIGIEERDDRIRISIYNSDELDCVTIFIYKKDEEAIIHNMSYHESCARNGLISPGGGSVLLRFTLNYLLHKKKKYGITKFIIQDNSKKQIEGCSSVSLSRLMMIVKGKTWYMNYGFLPYNNDKRSEDKYLVRDIKLNRKILKILKTAKIPIIKIVNKIKNIKNNDINLIKRLVEKYTLFRDFIIILNTDYKRNCRIISDILDYVYGTKILHDLHGKNFYLKI